MPKTWQAAMSGTIIEAHLRSMLWPRKSMSDNYPHHDTRSNLDIGRKEQEVVPATYLPFDLPITNGCSVTQHYHLLLNHKRKEERIAVVQPITLSLPTPPSDVLLSATTHRIYAAQGHFLLLNQCQPNDRHTSPRTSSTSNSSFDRNSIISYPSFLPAASWPSQLWSSASIALSRGHVTGNCARSTTGYDVIAAS